MEPLAILMLLLPLPIISIVWMGPHGRMVWVGNDWLSYTVAIGFLGIAGYHWLKLARSGWLLLQQVRTDPLLVAETLVSIVQSAPIFPDDTCVAFGQIATGDRLSRRIEALLNDLESTPKSDPPDRLFAISWLSISVLPLLTVPFHC